MILRNTLVIKLESDLCAGVGKHYSSIIDIDTALDEYGIPFIPSRRLKGCLKEIADYFFTADEIEAVFGKSGSDKPGCLSVSDAHIADYSNTVKALKNRYCDSKFPSERVAELFCSVRGQTAIENCTAKEESLRYIRVVNRTAPDSNSALEFYADIEYDSVYDKAIRKTVKGLRNIGYHRNRGLGSVNCRIEDGNCLSDHSHSDKSYINEKRYRIPFSVYLDSDLMLPGTNANQSLDYIPGTAVQGALASKWNARHSDTAEKFNDVFYSETVSFGNLYPMLGSCDTVPAPSFLATIKAATIKEDKGLKNIFKKADNDTKTYKNLKNGFVIYHNGKIDMNAGKTNAESKIVYHNANTKGDQTLYMQYCLCAGQSFSGYITAEGSKVKEISELLSDGVISFGRSRTAQYARCTLMFNPDEITEYGEAEKIKINPGTTGAFLFESAAVLNDENGNPVSDKIEIAKYFGVDEKNINEKTTITKSVVSGYNSKWNLKKPQFAVINARSFVAFEGDGNTYPMSLTIGEKQNEGFGRVLLIPDVKNCEFFDKRTDDKKKPPIEIKCNLLDLIEKNEKHDMLIAKAIDAASKIKGEEINATQTGRITLMAKESKNYEDFIERLRSIKRDKVQAAALRYFGNEKIENYDADWEELKFYLITVLTVRKYNLRKEGKADD